MKVFHGSDSIAQVLKAIAAARQGEFAINGDFHVAPKRGTAHNYGKHVAEFVLASAVEGAHVGLINKAGNINPKVGNEMEIVMKDDDAKFDFAGKIVSVRVFCPDGRVALVDADSGDIVSVQ